MKIVKRKYPTHVEILIEPGHEVNSLVYTFDDTRQAENFLRGFSAAQQVANSLIQSMNVPVTTPVPL